MTSGPVKFRCTREWYWNWSALSFSVRFWRGVMCKCCHVFAGVANQLVSRSIHVMVVSGFTGIVSRANRDHK